MKMKTVEAAQTASTKRKEYKTMRNPATPRAEWQRRIDALSPDALDLLIFVLERTCDTESLYAVLRAADPAVVRAVAGVIEALKVEEKGRL